MILLNRHQGFKILHHRCNLVEVRYNLHINDLWCGENDFDKLLNNEAKPMDDDDTVVLTQEDKDKIQQEALEQQKQREEEKED